MKGATRLELCSVVNLLQGNRWMGGYISRMEDRAQVPPIQYSVVVLRRFTVPTCHPQGVKNKYALTS